MGKPVVPYVAQPLHSDFGAHMFSTASLWRGVTTRGYAALCSPSRNSVLPANFNEHLCCAWNLRESNGVTHFAMLHGDIAPQHGWFDILYDELNATGADVVSAVVPIKSMKGQTSTAYGERLPNGRPVHTKLTMHDVFELPETFGIEDTPWPDKALLINTGCMAFRLDSWVRDFLLNESFGFETWCEENEDGRIDSQALSEDWRFSLWLAANGLRAVATRKVELSHWGAHPFSNNAAWGDPSLNAITTAEAVA
jgi:hypothetical protein